MAGTTAEGKKLLANWPICLFSLLYRNYCNFTLLYLISLSFLFFQLVCKSLMPLTRE